MLTRHIACSVLIPYVFISLVALTCVESMGSDHHRAAVPLDYSSHSLICALACQANIGASLSVALVGLFLASSWLAARGFASRSPANHPRQWQCVRGPPLSTYSL